MSNEKHQYPFEKLNVWHAAKKLAVSVYRETSRFPKSEAYGLTSQCNRAAVSVAANIAEGTSRSSRKDQAHYSQIAYGSLMEWVCLIVSHDAGILSAEHEQTLRVSIESVSAQLNALHRSQPNRS